MSKQMYFVVAVEIDDNGKPTTASLDDERALAVFDGADVWDETTEEWQDLGEGDNDDLFIEARTLLKSKLA